MSESPAMRTALARDLTDLGLPELGSHVLESRTSPESALRKVEQRLELKQRILTYPCTRETEVAYTTFCEKAKFLLDHWTETGFGS